MMRARGFIVLFVCDAFARSLLLSLVPLQAYSLLGAARIVSIVYFLVAILGLIASLTVPSVLHRVRRRWVLTAGAGLQIGSVVMFAVGTKLTLVLGLLMQAMSAAALDVAINIYLLDHIPRRGLNTFEPRRLMFAGIAFALGPIAGVYLQRHVHDWAPYLAAGLSTSILLAAFWRLRLSDTTSTATTGPPNPLRFVLRFFRQKRLALSWILALGRNGWWVMYYVYTPIYVASVGYSAMVGGAVLSLGMVTMLAVARFGRIGAIIGLRRLLAIGYGLTGLFSLAITAAAVSGHEIAAMALICLAAWSATIIDGAGNVPFLRAVRHYERVPMTSVFTTFRHVGSLVMPGIFAVVLWYAPLPAVFAVGGLIALAMAALSLLLPRGL